MPNQELTRTLSATRCNLVLGSWRQGQKARRRAKNFLNWRIYPIAEGLKIPKKLVTFQMMRRTLGADLRRHGTTKDAQGVLRHASI